MLHHDKHEGWQKLCDDCNEGRVEFHTTSYFGGIRNCHECDGAGAWQADLADFKDETVRLHNGIVVTVGLHEFFDMDGNAIGVADVSDIAAVLEAVSV
jgi:hypothetical protein